MKIDAHQHFWKYNPVRDAWIDESMQCIRRDFLPADLESLLKENGMDGCVSVQADQSEEETEFLLELARTSAFIKAVIGWVNLRADDAKDRLSHFARNEKFKGVRHILQAEPSEFMSNSEFRYGISCLEPLGLTYDILVYPEQLPSAIQLVRRFPNQAFVIDHLAKPNIKKQEIKTWEGDIRLLAEMPNVHCKISGMVTEADWLGWKPEDFKPYLDVVFDAFGTGRLMFGSDWPVCLLAAQYEEVLGNTNEYLEALTSQEKNKVMGGNALTFYNLK
ncbi:MAG: amidohydrolase family protein [Reichenbachiella sp.]|uniref:amidohydrolase family protein n=1 Tax=Reichenbachiella sp. TaxID=2184521 RepID=UPI0032658AC4